AEYHETCKQVLELYPSGNIPKVENLEKHIASLQKKLSKKIRNTIRRIRSPVSCPKQRER
ncbi:MAG: hypothetical protein SPK89_05240, partial [Ruminococcus flavefaciens]|nr:hypothetical protein [Ruminococcus flavefaciens]MDY5691049.1 hypothetical protein [Ruminococcus flavefaciens]